MSDPVSFALTILGLLLAAAVVTALMSESPAARKFAHGPLLVACGAAALLAIVLVSKVAATPASHAATASRNSTNTCPCRLPWNRAKATKLIATPCSIISAHRNMVIRFRRVRNPTSPIPNSAAATAR